MKLEAEAAQLGCSRQVEASEARQSFREIIDEAYAAGRRVLITRYGRPVAGLIAVRDLLHLRARDAAADARMLRSREQSGDGVRLEDLAATLDENEPEFAQGVDEVASAGIPVLHVAEDTVDEFVRATLRPELIENVRASIESAMRTELGDVRNLTKAEAIAWRQHLLVQLSEFATVEFA